jgi:hypothetical protein
MCPEEIGCRLLRHIFFVVVGCFKLDMNYELNQLNLIKRKQNETKKVKVILKSLRWIGKQMIRENKAEVFKIKRSNIRIKKYTNN